ncbi:DNA-3-methyladenine glycosylase 2 family protein, partial [Arthrospira platensis SPKY1]|nr:DNA-3-methyladenine glycosylase 2 family protein [Arthrospira platensis SPKY1]
FGLLRAIAYQQLSGKAAATIFHRFLALFPNNYPVPERLLAFSEAALRSAGLSRAKADYMRNIAHYFTEHKLFRTEWAELPDEDIMQMLTAIRGVGKWTAEMVLLFIL